jgi:hypothetical protein
MLLALCAVVGCSATTSEPTHTASPAVLASTRASASWLDRSMQDAWTKAGKTPSPEVDDATYLRRVSLDLLGRVPTANEVRAALTDVRPDRRARWVDDLLHRPEHAKFMARKWERILMGPEVKDRIADRGAMRRWLEAEFAKNAPWDRMVHDIVDAEGQSSVGGARGPAAYADDPDKARQEKDEGVNGATNFTLRFGKSPGDLAGATSRIFLGVQIQCAQCHDHKTEKWKQTDFRELAATFTHVKARPVDRAKGEIPVFDVESSDKPNKRVVQMTDEAILSAHPRALDDTDLAGADPRGALAAWMTSRDNPWFSREMVNRVWADLLGGGFVQPIDDFRPSNPAVLPEVLDALAEDFEASGYDLDHLYATICASEAYARSSPGGDESPRDALFAHQALRPLDSDQLLDSIFTATEADKLIDEKAPQRAGIIKSIVRRRMGFVFDADSEANGEEREATLQQALFALNGALPIAATSVKDGGFLANLLERADDAALVEELYLRTLGRRPTKEEIDRARTFLGEERGVDPKARKKKPKAANNKAVKRGSADPPAIVQEAVRSDAESDRDRGAEDLFWALINSSEFSFRR